MPQVHIVIPNYNNYHLVNGLLFSLYKYEKESIETILVVDDASTDEEVFTGLNWWKSNGMLPLSTVFAYKNVGFLLTANAGLKAFSDYDQADIVILLSTDVKIYGKFIHQIVQQLTQCQKSLVGGVLYQHDTGWNTFNGKTFPYIEGWLLATTVGNWKELGYLDERFVPFDFEDVSLSTQALSMGYTLHPLNSPMLKHLGGQSIAYGDERMSRTKINQKKFEAKWVK